MVRRYTRPEGMFMLRALLWDVDGTVAETERDGHRVAFNEAFELAGLPWHWDVAHYGRLLEITGGRERLLADMAERVGAPLRPEDREALARHLHGLKNEGYARLVNAGGIAARPGVLEVMAAARAAGLRQAIVTTTSRSNVQALLGKLLGAAMAGHASRPSAVEKTRSARSPTRRSTCWRCTSCGAWVWRHRRRLAIEDSAPGARAAAGGGRAAAAAPERVLPGPSGCLPDLPPGTAWGWSARPTTPSTWRCCGRCHARLDRTEQDRPGHGLRGLR
jgi:beta-phosphoglucomutase-like phosphatase (HAD superfamily)